MSTIRNIIVLIIAGEEGRQFLAHVVRKRADPIQRSTFRVLIHSAPLTACEAPAEVNARSMLSWPRCRLKLAQVISEERCNPCPRAGLGCWK